MTAQPFVVSRQDRTQPLNVVGEHITVLATAAQTGSCEIFFQAGPGGSGPPPHSHPWDEAFYVLRGEVAFGIGDRESLAVEGTLVQVPGGTTHWFRYGRGGGEMLSMTSGERDDVGRLMLPVMVQAHGGIAAGDRQGDDAQRACHDPPAFSCQADAGTHTGTP
jgi:quercetin dioxygenase-like cupin family protein